MDEKEKICCFFGHRDATDEIRSDLMDEIERCITDHGVNTFYVGGYGHFDSMAAAAVRELKKRYPLLRLYLVLAYLPGKDGNVIAREYDGTIYPEGLELAPRKFAIVHRNRWMAENCAYIISYVSLKFGGAYEAVRHAKAKNKNVINLAEKQKLEQSGKECV